MKKQLLSYILLCVSFIMYAQSEVDAIRFSTNELTGTARGVGMAGAFGALGGDITGIASNPAGIGVYRSSEILTSLDLASVGVNTNLDGSANDESKLNFSFNNVAYVSYCPMGDDNIKSFNYGFSYNRLKNFGRNYYATGFDQGASLTDYIAGISTANEIYYKHLEGEGRNPYNSSNGAPWISILGYNAYLIDDIEDYEYASAYPSGRPSNRLKVSEEGYINSYDFTGGLNLFDRLFLGITFSMTDLFYRTDSYYDEDFGNSNFFHFDNYYKAEGSGYQVSLGAIYHLMPQLRLGVAYHSPTWYSMTDSYQGTAEAFGNPSGYFCAPLGDGEIAMTDYRFQTPYQWTFSVAGVIGSRAIVSVDYEMKDYTSMSFTDTYGHHLSWNPNQWIKEDYRMASTVKTGIEYRLFPEISLRGGYAWMQSPLETSYQAGEKEVMTVGTMPHYTLQGDTQYLTLGLGIRITPQFYVDGAFVYRTQTSDLYGYSPVISYSDGNERLDVNPAQFKEEALRGIITVGYKF